MINILISTDLSHFSIKVGLLECTKTSQKICEKIVHIESSVGIRAHAAWDKPILSSLYKTWLMEKTVFNCTVFMLCRIGHRIQSCQQKISV